MNSSLAQTWCTSKSSKISPRFYHWLIRVSLATALSFLMPLVSHMPVGGQEQGQPTTPSQPQSNTNQNGIRPTLQTGSQGEVVEELQALLKLLGFYPGPVNGLYQESTAIAVVAFQRAAGIQADGVVGPATWDRLLPTPDEITNRSPVTPTPAATPQPSPQSSTPPQTTAPASGVGGPNNGNSGGASSSRAGATPQGDRPAQPGANSQTESVDLPILRIGMRGPAVTRLQERLRAVGLFNGTIDGIFGPETQAAVETAQRRYRLTPDGVVGPATWTALLQNN